MTLEEVQNEIVEEFSVFDDWLDKYEYIIEIGSETNYVNKAFRQMGNIVNGCQSKVWVDAQFIDGKIVFKADSDAVITKGIVALLVRVLSGRTPEEILNANLFFIDKIGFKQNLSPTRSNGLTAMIRKMKSYAVAFGNIDNFK